MYLNCEVKQYDSPFELSIDMLCPLMTFNEKLYAFQVDKRKLCN